MIFMLPSRIMLDPKLTPGAKLLYALLLSFPRLGPSLVAVGERERSWLCAHGFTGDHDWADALVELDCAGHVSLQPDRSNGINLVAIGTSREGVALPTPSRYQETLALSLGDYLYVEEEEGEVEVVGRGIVKGETSKGTRRKGPAKVEVTDETVLEIVASHETARVHAQRPGWRDTLLAFVENRRVMREPMTPHAVVLLLNTLDRFTRSEVEQIRIMEQSILSNWSGVFPLKGGAARAPERHAQTTYERLQQERGVRA